MLFASHMRQNRGLVMSRTTIYNLVYTISQSIVGYIVGELVTITIQNKTYFEEIHLVNSILELKTRNGLDDGFEIKPKYYSLNRFLFLTRVLN